MINKMGPYGLTKLFRFGIGYLKIGHQKCISTGQRYDIKGRVALVTGAASGIGAACAKALLCEGVKGVTLSDVDEKTLKETYCELAKCFGQKRVQFIKCDVLCPNHIEDAFKHTIKCFDQLDIVFNNAGILNECEVCRTVNINLTGVIIGTQLAIEKYLPKYRSCKEGIVINNASILGHTTISCAPTYCATKHGVIGFGKCYGDVCEYQQTQARVMSICPGFTESNLFSNSPRPQHKQKMKEMFSTVPYQKLEHVSDTFIHMIKCGCPGSAWIISNGKMEEAKIVEAYDIQSCFNDNKC